MLFLLDQLTGEFQRGANVFQADAVIALHIFESHPACQAANHNGNGQSRPANHGLAVANLRIDHNSGVFADNLVHIGIISRGAWPGATRRKAKEYRR